jgi:hypothetical protein
VLGLNDAFGFKIFADLGDHSAAAPSL